MLLQNTSVYLYQVFKNIYHYPRDCQKVDAKHQNKKAPLQKKVSNVKKRICFDPAHTQNVCMIKTEFDCIKKGFQK